MVNIVIPMAGLGSRFKDAGFAKPKPFIDVDGKPMIQRVLENLNVKGANFHLVAQQAHLESEPELSKQIINDFNAGFTPINGLTEGSACTVLFTKRNIDNETPLIIANSDQLIDLDLQKFVDDASERNLDGSIMVFKDIEKNPKWSFAQLDSEGFVTRVEEKIPISDMATVGIYYFKNGSFFVDSAIRMIIENKRYNNEFYTCPVYNYLIAEGKKIGVYEIQSDHMHGVGTPTDLGIFLSRILGNVQ